MLDGADGTAALLVVTDDRDLRHGARLRGARTAGSAWLLGRLGAGRLRSPSVGNPRPARGATAGPDAGHDQRRRPGRDGPPSAGSPGRGATTKRGNPRKAPKVGAERRSTGGDW